jgi:hypothetical protein
MCAISSIKAKWTGAPQPGQSGNSVCLRSQISSVLEQLEWSGRQMPETGTISRLRKGTCSDCFWNFSGNTNFSDRRIDFLHNNVE